MLVLRCIFIAPSISCAFNYEFRKSTGKT